MTSATEVLRRMLDERGVEWEDGGMPSTNTTFIVNGVAWHAMFRDGGIELHCEPVTPELAIAATLGATDAKPTQEESSGTFRSALTTR